MKKIAKKIESLEMTLVLIAMVSLYSTEHFIGGSVMLFFLFIAMSSLDKKKKDEPKPEEKESAS